MGGSQTHTKHDDLISLLTKIIGDTQTDGQTQTVTQAGSEVISYKPLFIFQNKERNLLTTEMYVSFAREFSFVLSIGLYPGGRSRKDV
jgi:hypothetical protein